jgi:hypothetical protein
MKLIFQLLCLICSVAPCPFAAATGYVGIDLYPLQTLSQSSPFPWSAANGMVVGKGVPAGDFNNHSILWTAPGGEPTDLQPAGIEISIGRGTDGVYQVGYGSAPNDFEHALLWQGTAQSMVDVHPTNLPGIQQSGAVGVRGTQQVGFIGGPVTDNKLHAALWNGSADSAVDLHPMLLDYFVESWATATDSVQQVGYGRKADDYRRALLWSGTAASAVDLHPPHFNGVSDSSEALGVGGSQQVGYAGGTSTSGRNHAFLWTGTADSAIDLHPSHLSGFFDTFAVATNGQYQVGYGGIVPNTSDFSHALLWSGTAASAVDLHTFLPASTFELGTSRALSIDAQGNIYGVATDAFGRYHAVMWVPVPEPQSGLLVSAAFGIVGSWIGVRQLHHRSPSFELM